MERIIPLCGIVRVEGVGGGGGGLVVIDYGGIGRHSWKAMSAGCVRTHQIALEKMGNGASQHTLREMAEAPSVGQIFRFIGA